MSDLDLSTSNIFKLHGPGPFDSQTPLIFFSQKFAAASEPLILAPRVSLSSSPMATVTAVVTEQSSGNVETSAKLEVKTIDVTLKQQVWVNDKAH